MRLARLAADTRPVPSALSRRLRGGEDGVLVIHGFTGWPGELRQLSERLNKEGLTVSLPRLPGHGTNARDFMESRWRDWLRRAVDEYLELAATVQRVHLVGFSMGGVLAILLASRFPVGRLVLAAPAVRIRNPFLPLARPISIFVRKARWSRPPEEDDQADDDHRVLVREYWTWRFPRESADLARLKRMARAALPRVTAPTLVLLGKRDGTVPTSTLKLVKDRIGTNAVEGMVLGTTGHGIYTEGDAPEAIAATVRWLVPPSR